MKTIEIITGGQTAQFTTKSVTFDGKEFLYANMHQVKHDTENHIYSFTYDGEVKSFPYEEKYAKVLTAIFSQVQKLEAQRDAKSAAEKENTAPEEAAAPSEEPTPSAESAEAESTEETAESKTAEEQEKDEQQEQSEESAAEEDDKSEKESKEKIPVTPEKKAKLKKSLGIFAIIIAAVIVASIVYYAVFGTNNDPSNVNPNNTESQQYDDIDQRIEDMQ